MEYRGNYEEWINNPYFDEAAKEELRGISDDEEDPSSPVFLKPSEENNTNPPPESLS